MIQCDLASSGITNHVNLLLIELSKIPKHNGNARSVYELQKKQHYS